MKLAEHVEIIRTKIYKAFNNQFSRLGVGTAKMMEIDRIPVELHNKREKIEVLIQSHLGETGEYVEAREKALDELTFTLFNRLAALKVMEAHQLIPPVITRQAEHGDRSFGHKAWLEQNFAMRNEELEGFRTYLKDEFNRLGEDIPLYHKNYPYALLPYVIDLDEITEAFNAVEKDPQTDNNIWKSDDILGWLYESYNNHKKKQHKEEGGKTEYNKVSLQSQVYTPRWVVEFLVNNSLGKLYLEMFPGSEIRNQYKIANAPKTQVRKPIRLHLLKLIDPATGSGNFLLYAFSFFYALYIDQIEHYGANYDEDEIPRLIIENNLHGIDLDDRAIQLAQLGLWIKARQKNRSIGILKFNVVSSDFFLPGYKEVETIFESDTNLDAQQKDIIREIWADLQQAYKFGSLIKIEEKLSVKLHGVLEGWQRVQYRMFDEQTLADYESFKSNFFKNLETAVTHYAQQKGSSFLTDKTHDAITFLKILTQKYDVATANPPYTDSADFGPELKNFIENNFKKPWKFNTNLYASFIKRCYELTEINGKIAMVHPPTFMYIKTFEDVRKFMLEKLHIDLFVEWGFLGMFNPKVRVDSSIYILDKKEKKTETKFIKLNHIYEGKRYYAFIEAYDKLLYNKPHSNIFKLEQSKLKIIKSFPFVYWISDTLRERFKSQTIEDIGATKPGLQTGLNERFLRFWWELDKKDFSISKGDEKKWVSYAKGGDYNKWLGNLWLKVNWDNNGSEIKNLIGTNGRLKSRPQNSKYYFKQGITYSATGGKPSFRLLPKNSIFDVGGASIFVNKDQSTYYALAVLNSSVTNFILDCLNPTSNFQKGDIDRLLFFEHQENKELVESLVKFNIKLKKVILSYSIIEEHFKRSAFFFTKDRGLSDILHEFLVYENILNTLILMTEAVLDKIIIDSFNFSHNDYKQIVESVNLPIGQIKVTKDSKEWFLNYILKIDIDIPNVLFEYIGRLEDFKLEEDQKESIVSELRNLYKDNYSLESFCRQKYRENNIHHDLNPIDVSYLFKSSRILPTNRIIEISMEYLIEILREILMEDEDGIIPLVPNAGEKVLLNRIEEKFLEKGFSRAQYSSFDSVLCRELNEYINRHFFKAFSDHLNLFQYLPKTPFIWHITSGPEQGFDCYIIIYKWNRDKLLRIRSVYIEHRERALVNRQLDLANDDSPRAQNEKEKIRRQLEEIERFKQKIDELLAENYNPVLDDGVGKNIAPLQKKGMLAYDVLNPGQLKKYLNADW